MFRDGDQDNPSNSILNLAGSLVTSGSQGRGKEYESYGGASIGDTADIIGKSADGSFWVIKISTDFAPDGRGWVIATYVNA